MELFVNEVRLSFPDLRKRGRPPKERPTELGKYGCQGIFAINSPAHIAVRNAVIAVAKEKWPQGWEAIIGGLGNDKKCLRKGDMNLDDKGVVRPEYKGMMYVKASNKEAVPLIGARAKVMRKQDDGTEKLVWNILPPESGKPYGGCVVNMKIDVYAMDSKDHGKGVHATLLAVQFVRDGEAFGGAPATADGFGDVEGAEDEDAPEGMEGIGEQQTETVGGGMDDLGL